MNTEANQPAFPQTIEWTEKAKQEMLGLTKREYFAAMAMIGLLFRKDDLHPVDMVAEKAIKQADALLNQLNKPIQ